MPALQREKIKFTALLDKALAVGFDAVMPVITPASSLVRRGANSTGPSILPRTSPYVLGVLTAEQLDRAFFPLGEHLGSEVRGRRRTAGSPSPANPTPMTSASSPTATPAPTSTVPWASDPETSSTPRAGPRPAHGHPRLHHRTAARTRPRPFPARWRAALCRRDRRHLAPVTIATGDLLGVRAIHGIRPTWCGPAPAPEQRLHAQIRAHGAAHAATVTHDDRRLRVVFDETGPRRRARTVRRAL